MPIVAKLDELGKPGWIALMILGFFIWWPLGLATLAFIMGSGRMTSSKGGDITRWYGSAAGTWWQPSPRPSGNRAFDEYRQEALRREEGGRGGGQGSSGRLRMGEEPGGVSGVSSPPANGEGQGGIRSVHGGASDAYRFVIIIPELDPRAAVEPLSHHDHHLWLRLRRLGARPLPWRSHCPDRRACDSA